MLLRHDAGDVYAHADVLYPKERKKGFCRDEENAEKINRICRYNISRKIKRIKKSSIKIIYMWKY